MMRSALAHPISRRRARGESQRGEPSREATAMAAARHKSNADTRKKKKKRSVEEKRKMCLYVSGEVMRASRATLGSVSPNSKTWDAKCAVFQTRPRPLRPLLLRSALLRFGVRLAMAVAEPFTLQRSLAPEPSFAYPFSIFHIPNRRSE